MASTWKGCALASHLGGTGVGAFKARLHELLEPSPSRDLPGKLLDGVLLVISSTVVYYAENRAQPEVFSSIPATM